MSNSLEIIYKLKDKFLAADIFDGGRLEKFGLREMQWSDNEDYKEWATRHRRHLISDGEDQIEVEVELDGSVQYVKYQWWSIEGQGHYPDILEKLVKALNTDAEALYCVTGDDDQLQIACKTLGIDSGLGKYDADDPHRHDKILAWRRDGRAKAEAAVAEAYDKETAAPGETDQS